MRHASGAESNTASFVLRPRIQDIQATGVSGSVDAPREATIELQLAEEVGKSQRVTLLLNQIGVAAPVGYSFSLLTARDTDSALLEIPIRGVNAGTYLVRVRVDGAESPVTASGAPEDLTYTDPSVVIP